MLLSMIICVVSALILIKWLYNTRIMAPGPWGVPVFGYLPFLGSNPGLAVQKLAEKYGDVMRVNLLGTDVYFLNSLHVVKEAFVAKGDNFCGRPVGEFNSLNFLLTERSITTSEGDFWRVHHKFILGKLTKLGVGKSEFESKIHGLCDSLVNYIRDNCGKEVDYSNILMNFASNVISTLIYSKHYDMNDPSYIPLREIICSLFASDDSIATFLTGNIFYAFVMINRKVYRLLVQFKKHFHSYLNAVLIERLNSRNETEFDDLLDGLLKEGKGPNSEYFDEQSVINDLVTLFAAGTVTTAKTLCQGLYLMAINTDIQRKVHEEIDNTIGKDEQVSLKHSSLLNYTNAVIAEIHRYSSIGPFSLLHTNRVETTIGGYRIPVRSKVVANIRCLSRDKRIFSNPDNFDPNRFLDENGKYVANEANIPFSIGRRKCTGAKLAEMEILICFVTLLQKFCWNISNNEIVSNDIWALSARYKLVANKR